MMSLSTLLRTCTHDPRFLGGLIAVPFIALVAHTAVATGILLLLFPELGALSMDVFSRPGGLWARHPAHLAFTPALTAVLGLTVTRHLGYGFFSVGLVVAGSILILQVLKSPIAPAISAAVLPLALGIKSWWYPAAILLGTASLALASTLHRKSLGPEGIANRAQATDATDDLMEATAGRYQWIVFFCVFLGASLLLVRVTGWRLILFPPAVVIGYEMFAHDRECPWARRPYLLPVACVLTATAGLGFTLWFGVGAGAAAASMVFGILVLQLMDLHIPPALAIGLLPLAMEAPDYRFPLSVALGMTLLTLIFLLHRKLALRRFPATA